MNRTKSWTAAVALSLVVVAVPARAINTRVPGIHGDQSRALLGDGTGILIGIVDSGVDDLHPALAGVDSLGNPRLVAESNFVTTEPANSGDDVVGHGTAVASAALSRDSTFTGMASDARYINARVLDSNNSFPSDNQVRNGIGYAIDGGADVINLSLNFFGANSSGGSQLDMMIDWAAFDRGIHCAACVGNISQGNGVTQVRGPGSAYNVVTVGRTTTDFSRVHTDSATAFTADHRLKPDVVAPGSGLTVASDDWEGAATDWRANFSGCSFATPLVAGLIAQQLEAGARLGLSTDPLVVKATIMNSATKILDKNGGAWEPSLASNNAGVFTATEPLDPHSGAGQVDGLQLASQYLVGETAPGLVAPIGWDLNSIGGSQSVDYVIAPPLGLGSTLTATLTWYRHVGRTDDGDGIIDAGDSFTLLQGLSDLQLSVLRDGSPIAQSTSSLDNLEHLNIPIDQQAQYTLRVTGLRIGRVAEQFALAWSAVAVPEPTAMALALFAVANTFVFANRRPLNR
jgi:hypothetical protein